ncbi:MAG: toprim domain-containing protein [Candidatus Nanohaloarchaea archaeon]
MFDKINNRLNMRDLAKPKNEDSDNYFKCGICNDSDAALKTYEEGNWKCFSCKATGGDIVNYYAQKEDLKDGAAARELAEKFDIDIEQPDELSEEAKQERKNRKRVRNCQEDVVSKAEENMPTSKLKALQDKRGWSRETIQDLRIGWMNEDLFNSLKERYGNILEETGIHYGMTGSKEGTYVFPHLKRNGQPYLITCRDPEKKDYQKYQQSKSTEYVENDIFFATGRNSDVLIVTEGYPDAYEAYECGYDAVAAGCGSFEGNRNRIASFSDSYEKVIVVLDNDETGKEETQKIGRHLSKTSDAETMIYQWDQDRPKGFDLDDYGSEKEHDLEEMLSQSKTFLEALKNYNPSSIDASLINEKISVRGNIKGQKQGQAIPRMVLATCMDCGEQYTKDFSGKRDLEAFLTSRQNHHNLIKSKLSKNACEECKGKDYHWKGLDYFDKAWVQLQDLIEESESFSTNQNNKIPAYIIGDKLPDSKTVKIEGTVHVNQQTDQIFIIGDKVEPETESFHNIEFEKEDHQEYQEKWDKEKAEQMVDPEMIGRPKSRTALQLAVHSPVRIPTITGKTTRGALRVNFFGDGGTNKSKQVKLLTKNNYQLGGFINAETGSRTGLLYTINTDKNVIEWGALPLNDMGLLGIDGFNEMNDDELTQMREVMEDLQVEVNRSVQGSAPARTRIIACMNPEETPMAYEYKNPAKALEEMEQFSGPDYRRWDLFVPFGKDDVDQEEINYRDAGEKPYSEQFYRKHVLWAWNLDPKDIFYTERFSRELKSQSYKLVNSYEFADLQIVSGAFREKLTRLSVAWAILEHSVTEDGRVKVTADHVLKVKDFFSDLMDELGLSDAKQDFEERTSVDEEAAEEIVEDLDDEQLEILKVVYEDNPVSSADIAEEIGSSDRTVKKKWKALKKEELVEVRSGQGATTTPRCMQFVDIVEKNLHEVHAFTNDSTNGGGVVDGENKEKDSTHPPTDSEINNESVKNVKQNRPELSEFVSILQSNDGVLHFSEIRDLGYDVDYLEDLVVESDKLEKGFGAPDGSSEVENRFELKQKVKN